ncbi:MAG TPA: DUF3634 family protein [Myxococcota bacterium]|nr:DUF3634 family protein [Myxococcota bacterium]HRY93396.1 DUF3634 family protein [Myxococcota bacterium]HSA20384.1 DUF3634 family protein [Myxococcota bacterium]
MIRLLPIALLGLLAWGAWILLRRRNRLFELRVERGGGLRVRGQVPGRRLPDVVEFVASLRLRPGACLWGVKSDEPAGFRVLVSDDVPMGVQQQIRNYLYSR